MKSYNPIQKYETIQDWNEYLSQFTRVQLNRLVKSLDTKTNNSETKKQLVTRLSIIAYNECTLKSI